MARRWGYVTPQDWAVLLNREPGHVKAGRMGGAAAARGRADKRAAGRALALAAAEMRVARYRRPWWPPNPGARWRVMLARMKPGVWYGARELAQLAGCNVRTVRVYVLQHAAAYLERRFNPDYQGVVPPQIAAWRYVEPRYLVRLKETGAARAPAVLS